MSIFLFFKIFLQIFMVYFIHRWWKICCNLHQEDTAGPHLPNSQKDHFTWQKTTKLTKKPTKPQTKKKL